MMCDGWLVIHRHNEIRGFPVKNWSGNTTKSRCKMSRPEFWKRKTNVWSYVNLTWSGRGVPTLRGPYTVYSQHLKSVGFKIKNWSGNAAKSWCKLWKRKFSTRKTNVLSCMYPVRRGRGIVDALGNLWRSSFDTTKSVNCKVKNWSRTFRKCLGKWRKTCFTHLGVFFLDAAWPYLTSWADSSLNSF